MAVLKANGSFLKANGKILVARGGGNVIYLTNFKNFDFNTGIDIPIQGSPLSWIFHSRKNLLSKTQIEVNDVVYDALKFAQGTGTPQINLDLSQIDEEQITFRTKYYVVLNTSQFSGGTEHTIVSPYWNLYYSNRGIGVKNMNLSNRVAYNDFSYDSSTSAYYANWYGRFDLDRIIDGGFSINRSNNRVGAFLFNKKAVEGISSNLNAVFDIYTSGGGGEMYVIEFKIEKGFLFDELE